MAASAVLTPDKTYRALARLAIGDALQTRDTQVRHGPGRTTDWFVILLLFVLLISVSPNPA
jgi:hypothetical protein